MLIKSISPIFLLQKWMIAISLFVSFAISPLHAQPEGFADLVETLSPAVVNIATKRVVETNQGQGQAIDPSLREFFRRFGMPELPPGFGGEPSGPRERSSLGSGFIIDGSEGLVVSNNHVVEGADEILVRLENGETLNATVIGSDPRTDVALLKVETDEILPAVKFGDSDKARIGDWVIAIGNPHGLWGTVTAGIISARGRNIGSGPYDDFIQTDAPINPGNSGGPLFNMDGEVIGINTAIFSSSGGSIGIGFSIPSKQAQDVIAQLREFGETKRGWLGVQLGNVTEDIAESLGLDDAYGAMVVKVQPDSPAMKGGIERDDIILELNGERVKDTRDLAIRVSSSAVGETVTLTILRAGEMINLDVILGRLETLAERGFGNEDKGQEKGAGPSQDFNDELGFSLANLTAELRQDYRIADDVRGIIVTGVTTDGMANQIGIRPGFVIQSVNQRSINNLGDFKDQLAKTKQAGRNKLLLRLMRPDGQITYEVLSID